MQFKILQRMYLIKMLTVTFDIHYCTGGLCFNMNHISRRQTKEFRRKFVGFLLFYATLVILLSSDCAVVEGVSIMSKL